MTPISDTCGDLQAEGCGWGGVGWGGGCSQASLVEAAHARHIVAVGRSSGGTACYNIALLVSWLSQ